MREAGGNSLAFPCHEAAKKKNSTSPVFRVKICTGLKQKGVVNFCFLDAHTHCFPTSVRRHRSTRPRKSAHTRKKDIIPARQFRIWKGRINTVYVKGERAPSSFFLLPAAIRKSIRENGRSPIRLGGEGRRGIFALSPSHWGRREGGTLRGRFWRRCPTYTTLRGSE